MNEPLTINWVKATQTKAGKDKLDVSVTKADKTTLDVTVWPDFPNYANLAPGQTIQAKIIAKDYNGKTYYSLAYDNPAMGVPRGGNKTAMMDKMMDKKAGQIHQAMDEKSLGIKISSSMNKAIDLTIAQIGSDPIVLKDTNQMKKIIKEWRAWIWENWEAKETDYQPFPSDEPVIQVDEGYGDMAEQL